MTTTPTPQVTASVFFGAGAMSYPWWDISGAHGAFEMNEPDDWWVDLIVLRDADTGQEEGRKTVNHAVVMDALRKIVSRSPELGVTRAVREEAALFLEGFDEADFDAGAADQVLQVAVLGKVTFG